VPSSTRASPSWPDDSSSPRRLLAAGAPASLSPLTLAPGQSTQTLVYRFLEALATAETSLSSLSTSVSQLDQLTQLLASTTPQLTELVPLPRDLMQAADRLAQVLRPSARRIWLHELSDRVLVGSSSSSSRERREAGISW